MFNGSNPSRGSHLNEAPLFVARRSFGIPNYTPRASIGTFSGATDLIGLVLTDPRSRNGRGKSLILIKCKCLCRILGDLGDPAESYKV